ncbi:Putative uncharacterized protein [Moritella viscosa]|uniref:hypothetical protein n=1 Tax=Moritella viscosa TaxID=80854 RepID=UPI00091C97E7|nr:hypothetical protein [Moritella viscosa]SGZ09705.1 Putative uncharacterized protein [Moritella viscosa]
MSISKPYKRTARIFEDGSYSNGGKWQYILNPAYASNPQNYIRAFLLIQDDLKTIFNYIEPSYINRRVYSHRINELLLRTCVEVEANCKAILQENGYEQSGYWNMGDYKKIEQSHFLSKFEIKIPNWHGQNSVRTPFKKWESNDKLPWYEAYHATKHDRYANFCEANLDNLLDAICGLAVIIASQFIDYDFSPAGESLGINSGGPCDGFSSSIGGFFRIKFPEDVAQNQRYGFDHNYIDFENDIFQEYPYS